MSKVPRASLCITILGDEDFRVLMASRGGAEAFGVFTAILIVGRERLQQGQARQVSETDSLRFDNSTTHILALACVSSRQLQKTLETLEEVAKETGGKPWLYLDESKHLVIRSFFKFNTSSGWGGHRPGAGRPPKGNQDDFGGNQDDSSSESSRIPSGSGSGTGLNSPLPPKGGVRAGDDSDSEEEPFIPPPGSGSTPTLEAIGKNSVEDVSRAWRTCREAHDADSQLWTWCTQWLHDYPASHVCSLLIRAKGKHVPSRWIETVIAKEYKPEAAPPREFHQAAPDSPVHKLRERERQIAAARRKQVGNVPR